MYRYKTISSHYLRPRKHPCRPITLLFEIDRGLNGLISIEKVGGQFAASKSMVIK